MYYLNRSCWFYSHIQILITHCFCFVVFFIISKLLVMLLSFGETSNINVCNCCWYILNYWGLSCFECELYIIRNMHSILFNCEAIINILTWCITTIGGKFGLRVVVILSVLMIIVFVIIHRFLLLSLFIYQVRYLSLYIVIIWWK